MYGKYVRKISKKRLTETRFLCIVNSFSFIKLFVKYAVYSNTDCYENGGLLF